MSTMHASSPTGAVLSEKVDVPDLSPPPVLFLAPHLESESEADEKASALKEPDTLTQEKPANVPPPSNAAKDAARDESAATAPVVLVTEPNPDSTASGPDAGASPNVKVEDEPSAPDFIERLFSKVEEESERRAAAAERAEREAAAEELAGIARAGAVNAKRSSNGNASLLLADGSKKPAATGRKRGGSLSVSRFGEAPTPDSGNEVSVPPTPSRLSAIVLQSPNYQKQIQAASTHTLSDDEDEEEDEGTGQHGASPILEESGSGPSSPAHPDRQPTSSTGEDGEEEEQNDHFTQVTAISGKQTLSKAVARRLSRAGRSRSQEMLAAPPDIGLSGMLIGVEVKAVTKTTTKASDPGTRGPSPDDAAGAQPSGADAAATTSNGAATQNAERAEGEEEEEELPNGMTSTVHRPTPAPSSRRGLEKKRSRLSLFGGDGVGADWRKNLAVRAKSLSKKLGLGRKKAPAETPAGPAAAA